MISKTYGIVGGGKLAGHLLHYFRLKNLDVRSWHRKMSRTLENALLGSDVILVVIKDDQIEDFIKQHAWLKDKAVIHCSGSLETKHAQGFHPLFNFSHRLYTLDVYEKIPFVVEQGSYSFSELFPTLVNPHFEIPRKQRALYHALAVVSGNFPTILWQAAATVYKKKLNLPSTFFVPYLENCVREFAENPEDALTGPLVRDDKGTMTKNIKALKGTGLDVIYKTFVKQFPKIKRSK